MLFAAACALVVSDVFRFRKGSSDDEHDDDHDHDRSEKRLKWREGHVSYLLTV